MKKILLLIIAFGVSEFGFAQVGINTTAPNAQLDIRSSNQLTPANTDGILIPKIDAFPLVNPTAAQQGMMVYLTTVAAGKQPGFYYWDNTGTPQWRGFGGTIPNGTALGNTMYWDGTAWVNNSSFLFNDGTAVGVNTAAPSSVFTVKRNGIGFTQEDSTGNSKIGFYTVSGGAWLQTHGFTDLSFATNNGATQMVLQKTTGNLGINNLVPSEKLDVIGKTKTTDLQVTNGAGIGKVLTSDAVGNATWQTTTGGWSLTGNSGTTSTTNFIGTTDSSPLVFKTNSQFSGKIENSSQSENTFFGYQAGMVNVPSAPNGSNNVAFGCQALNKNTTGYNNAAFGHSALFSNVDGTLNVALGSSALYTNSSGTSNVGLGVAALRSNTTGSSNVGIGYFSLYANDNGSNNVGVGQFALVANTTGSNNVGIGISSLNANTTVSDLVAIGKESMYSNTSGTENTAIGSESLRANTAGSKNIAVGYRTLFKQSFSNAGVAFDSRNIAMGYGALHNTNSTSNLNGSLNIGIGYFALANNGNGNSNIALGNSSMGSAQASGGAMTGNLNIGIGGATLKSISSGDNNIALGSSGLGYNSVGDNNISLGVDALFYSTAQSNGLAIGTRAMQNYALFSAAGTNDNVAIGYESLKGTLANAVYNQNTAVGYQSITANTAGNKNTALGYTALATNTIGNSNTALGNSALFSNSTGSGNIAIGYQAGFSETGSNKLYIENSTSATPLIYGEFDNDLIRVNGKTEGIYTQLTANGDGQSSIYGYRTRDSQNDGTSYSRAGTNKATSGYNLWGDLYTFGVTGHSDNDFTRTGGVLGSVTGGTYWSSLGYKNSAATTYGVYATAALATGTGRSAQSQSAFGIGGGFYGDIIGSWSKGNLMGTISSGSLFASYNSGDEYTAGRQVEIVQTATGKKAVYTVTSTESVVYKKGKIALQQGSAHVAFDADYAQLLGDTPIVTTTPMGNCNGIYIESVDKNGFTVRELNNGSSNVMISWISVGDRIDAGRSVSRDVMAQDFDDNINQVMFNENIKDGSAKAIWSEGKTIGFGQLPESLIEKPIKNEDKK